MQFYHVTLLFSLTSLIKSKEAYNVIHVSNHFLVMQTNFTEIKANQKQNNYKTTDS